MYDVIVIGQDVSSLLAAIRSAQLGNKVVLISEEAPPDRIELDGYSFDLDPFPWPSIENPENTGAHSFLKAFGGGEETGQALFHSGLQVIHPEHRIDFLSGKYAYLKELSREFPSRSPEIGRFLAAAESAESAFRSVLFLLRNSRLLPGTMKIGPKLLRSLFSWSLNRKILKEIPELRAILSAQSSLFSNSCLNGEIPFSHAYLLMLPLKGAGWLTGHKWPILGELRALLKSSGGGLIASGSIRRLLAGREIEAVVQDQEREVILSGKALILSAKWKGMSHLVQDDKISKWIRRHAKLNKKAYHPFTLHLGVNERGLPEKMAENVILVHPERIEGPVPGCPITFVHAGSSGDTQRAPAGRRAVSATVFLETSPCEIDDDRMRAVPEIVLERLNFFLPFLKENVEKTDPAMSINLSRKYQQVVNGKYGTNGGLLGFPLVSDMMPKRNIALTGGELFPGLGFEGEIISGIEAANRISGGKK